MSAERYYWLWVEHDLRQSAGYVYLHRPENQQDLRIVLIYLHHLLLKQREVFSYLRPHRLFFCDRMHMKDFNDNLKYP